MFSAPFTPVERAITSFRAGTASPSTTALPDAPSTLAYRFPEFSFASGANEIVLLGRETQDGVDCEVVGFVQENSDLYFRLWIGVEDHLVRRLMMMGPGHFMDTSYYDFNVPNAIDAPQ